MRLPTPTMLMMPSPGIHALVNAVERHLEVLRRHRRRRRHRRVRLRERLMRCRDRLRELTVQAIELLLRILRPLRFRRRGGRPDDVRLLDDALAARRRRLPRRVDREVRDLVALLGRRDDRHRQRRGAGGGGGGRFRRRLRRRRARGRSSGCAFSRWMTSDFGSCGDCRLASCGSAFTTARANRPYNEPPARWTINETMSPMRRKRRVRARPRALIMSWEITFLGLPEVP